MSTNDIQIRNLHKSFADKEVLKGVNLSVAAGSIYGLLGANGAGKTTIFKVLTGLMRANEGEMEVCGKPCKGSNSMEHLGILIETPVFYEHLSAAENLRLHLAYMDKPGLDIQETLALVGLGDVGKKPASSFSLGMRQRLAIARALVHDPKILILDEPINGLDPLGIIEMRDLFLHLSREKGKTLVISSHILSEIEHVADTVGVLAQGIIVSEESMKDLKENKHVNLEEYFLSIMRGEKKYA